MWADQTQRDAAGFLSASHAYRTSSYALTVEDIDLGGKDVPHWFLPSSILGTIRIRVTPLDPSTPIFVGIAPTVAERTYLDGVKHAEIKNFSDDRVAVTEGGGAPSAPPSESTWLVERSGSGPQTIFWHPRSGSWSVVVMNADASRGVAVAANAGATVPSLLWIASGLLIAGGVFMAIAIVLLVLGIRRPKRRIAPAG